MITEKQQREIHRLASLWATARVRRNLVRVGHGGHGETVESTQARSERTEADLLEYLNEITQQDEQ